MKNVLAELRSAERDRIFLSGMGERYEVAKRREQRLREELQNEEMAAKKIKHIAETVGSVT